MSPTFRSIVGMVRLLIGLLVVGGRRLDHVSYVTDDPVFVRFCRMQLLPTARTVSRWLTRFTMKTVERLQALNAAVIAQVIPGLLGVVPSRRRPGTPKRETHAPAR